MKTLVIFRDCHAKNNIVVPIESEYEERFYRNFARRMGWPCTTRKPRTANPGENRTEARPWRKASTLANKQRTDLAGAFKLSLTEYERAGK